MTEKEPIVYAYHAVPGQKPYGVPTRSLTQAAFDRLTPDQQREVRASSMFRAVTLPSEKKGDDKKKGGDN